MGNKRGFALILSFMVATVLLILSAAMLSRSIGENRLVQRYTFSQRAFWLAEAGIQRALWELNYGNNTWVGWGGSQNSRTLAVSLASAGDYSLIVNTLPGGAYQLNSIGYYPAAGASNVISRTLTAVAQRVSPFNYSVLGLNSVFMNGGITIDSYNSNNGPYQSGNAGANGDVGTNGTGRSVINLNGSGTINGDLSTGPGGSIDTGHFTINGDQTHTNNVSCPSVVVPVELRNLTSSGPLSLDGTTKIFDAGDYKYSEISLKGTSKLIFNGDVRIYLEGPAAEFKVKASQTWEINGSVIVYTDGNVDIGGSAVFDANEQPLNFIVYGTPTATSIDILGDANFCGAVYAPQANINVAGNGSLYGSLVGRSVNSIRGDVNIHYDEALLSVPGPSGRFIARFWRDTQNP